MLVGMAETQMMDKLASSGRAPGVRSAPQPLESRGLHCVLKSTEESEEARENQRCAEPRPSHGSLIYVTANKSSNDDDHVAPFRRKTISGPSTSSFAGLSGTIPSSNARMSRHQSMTPQTTQLQMVEEHEELPSPLSSASSIARSSTSASAATIADDSDGITASPRLTKRVSFSEAASDVMLAPSFPLSSSATTSPTRSSWSGFFRPAVSRPPPVKQVYVPPARGQAAGRSILKRTSSYGDARVRESPMDNDIEIPPLAPGRSKVVKAGKVETSHKEFVDVDLTERSSMGVSSTPSSNVAARPELVRSRFSYEQKVVRHWNMVGSNWMRRSGLCAGG